MFGNEVGEEETYVGRNDIRCLHTHIVQRRADRTGSNGAGITTRHGHCHHLQLGWSVRFDRVVGLTNNRMNIREPHQHHI